VLNIKTASSRVKHSKHRSLSFVREVKVAVPGEDAIKRLSIARYRMSATIHFCSGVR
jgi:hypothetical protein